MLVTNLERLTAVNFVTMLISIFSWYVWQKNIPNKSIESILVWMLLIEQALSKYKYFS